MEKKSVMVTNFGVFKDKCTMQTAILRVDFAYPIFIPIQEKYVNHIVENVLHGQELD